MEDSDDMDCERDNHFLEKSKRRLKTPAQVQALEKFYNEHKYPSESMKLQFAKQIGLSEKQVAGWFCHRRSKDKRLLQDECYVNRKQNPSAVAIHDSTSGFGQESCNSTKQVDRYFDGKEVESNRFHGKKNSAAVPEQRGKLSHVNVVDDQSSGSSTTSYERLLKQGVDEDCMYTNIKNGTKRGYMVEKRSSYLLDYVESPAVSMVKLKLGREYHEDGPPLATDFDPLPPGAFDSPVRDADNEPYYVGDPIQPRSCSIDVIAGNNERYNKFKLERIPNGLCPRAGYDRNLQRFNLQSNNTSSQLTPEFSDIKNYSHTPSRIFIMEDKNGDFTGEASYDYRRKNMRPSKYRLNEVSANNIDIPSSHQCSAPLSQRELYGAKISKPAVKSRTKEHFPIEEIVKPKGTLKILKKIHKQNGFRQNCNSILPEMLVTSDTQMTRKVHGEVFGSKWR
ncbi:uncharacterized protein A4U43_C07F16250 [Asparagus officinalis]|uniref:Homeobox domain-containing protein n=1 Tax=Asparagus officinalis TaxID=4686 RepID=A0A5P1EED0_ASPOF|nr:uncharacterized protein LOC109848545 [Asparagus officinalis]ONK63537.1 uncharacterized protein A4U43_C07F16250 [Asparagus officinalis]